LQEKTTEAKRSVDKDGLCELQRSPSVPYQTAKVEYLGRSPDLILFNDFITEREAEQLQEMAVPSVRIKI